jgi:hypothetical protein
MQTGVILQASLARILLLHRPKSSLTAIRATEQIVARGLLLTKETGPESPT